MTTIMDQALPHRGFSADDGERERYQARIRALQWRKRLLPAVACFGILAIWEIAVRGFEIPPFLAPAPSAVAQVLYADFGLLMSNLLTTATEAILGFIIGNLAALIIATVFVYHRTTEEAFFPIAVMVHTVPVLAYAPILVLLLGNGLEAKIAISALICFFPTLVNMTRGLRNVSAQQLELMRILSASPREVFVKLRIKSSLPYLFSALKIAASTAVIGAIVGEWIGASNGLGALIIQATYNYNSPLLYATIVVGSAFSGLFFAIVSWAERRTLTWNVDEARS